MKPKSIATATLRTHRLHSLMAPGNISNPAIFSSLQITSQLVARGAGGRGEALGIYIYIYIYVSVTILPCEPPEPCEPLAPGELK